jgi:hypothetical protein
MFFFAESVDFLARIMDAPGRFLESPAALGRGFAGGDPLGVACPPPAL